MTALYLQPTSPSLRGDENMTYTAPTMHMDTPTARHSCPISSLLSAWFSPPEPCKLASPAPPAHPWPAAPYRPLSHFSLHLATFPAGQAQRSSAKSLGCKQPQKMGIFPEPGQPSASVTPGCNPGVSVFQEGALPLYCIYSASPHVKSEWIPLKSPRADMPTECCVSSLSY